MTTMSTFTNGRTARPAAAATRTRRALLAALGCGLALASAGANAFDLSLPRFSDLRPKWEAVAVGESTEQVLQRMGEPNARSESNLLGVSRVVLAWKDMRGYRYTARFVAGRLYAKDLTDSP